VAELVQAAIKDGATIAFAGDTPSGDGTYHPAMLLSDVPADSRIVREEIFGPVAPIVRFTSEDEVIAIANQSEYGLASYVFTDDLDRAIRVSERLEVGMVGLNRGVLSNVAAPFGGVKASGFGREGGDEGIEEYLETKYVAVGVKASR
jgi:succinate-semialdehyde dehydrogenase/glutarate-semialdehyde dehydrogenase